MVGTQVSIRTVPARFRVVALTMGLSLGAGGTALAESLWEPSFVGLIAGERALRIGDLVTVEIDSAANFDFEATASDNKTLSLSLSGGDLGDLFSFLPSGGSSGNLATGGVQSHVMRASVGTRVVDTDGDGNARLEGTRSVTLSGRQESISVAGWLDPASLAPGAARMARFSQLADGTLSVSSFLAPDVPILTAADLVLPQTDADLAGATSDDTNPLLAPAAAPDVDELLAAAGQGDATAANGGSATSERAKLALTEDRQRELLLQYLNRLIDLIFQ